MERVLAKLLGSELPCTHSLRECLEEGENMIRFTTDDIPVIMCPLCQLAWPMWGNDFQIRVKPEVE